MRMKKILRFPGERNVWMIYIVLIKRNKRLYNWYDDVKVLQFEFENVETSDVVLVRLH